MKPFRYALIFYLITASTTYVDYTGHKVFTIIPKLKKHLQWLRRLHDNYNDIDFWDEPTLMGAPVMIRLKPDFIRPVKKFLRKHGLNYTVALSNLQSVIAAERSHLTKRGLFNFGTYNRYEAVVELLKALSSKYPDIAKLEIIGESYEKRPIYNMRISSGDGSAKPAIIIDSGIHAREWASVAVGAYILNRLITKYGSDRAVTSLVDKYEFNIIVILNPDGYVFTWEQDRLWRKTRSRSRKDILGICRGADANRNFDINHCGNGSSKFPCSDSFCGDEAFSESEARALRDLAIAKKDRLEAYFTIHAFSQLWMTPYGFKKSPPPNYAKLIQVGKAGVGALAKRYGTEFKLGSIANIIYVASGSTVDYMYEKVGVKIAFALELRDKGQYGFLLPEEEILPMCRETWDGITAAIQVI